MTRTDFTLTNHGSIMLLRPNTRAAKHFVTCFIEPTAQMFGNAVAIEPRYVPNIINGIKADGLTLLTVGLH